MSISFEIVPRNAESLIEQRDFIRSQLDFIDTINVPDLLRMPIRSWEASSYIDRKQYRFIPHFRAIDFNLKESRLLDIIEQFALDRILLVSGDPPPNMSHRVYDTKLLDMIEYVRNLSTELEIYAGFDSYRSSIKQEAAYMKNKIEAGASYLLSQPFFDLRLLEIYSEILPQEQVFWGISPVVSEKSMSYWQKVNNAVFPASFDVTYEWNIDFALHVLKFIKQNQGNAYFMPITIDLAKYFLPIASAIKTE